MVHSQLSLTCQEFGFSVLWGGFELGLSHFNNQGFVSMVAPFHADVMRLLDEVGGDAVFKDYFTVVTMMIILGEKELKDREKIINLDQYSLSHMETPKEMTIKWYYSRNRFYSWLGGKSHSTCFLL